MQEKIGTASDGAKNIWTAQILAHGQQQVAHVVKTCNTRKTHNDNPCSSSD